MDKYQFINVWTERGWRKRISFPLKDFFPTFYTTNLFLQGITFILCLQRLILSVENARWHKMINFPTVSSCKRILLDIPREHFALPLRNCFRLSAVFKKILPKPFSCVNVSRVGSPRHSLEKDFCMQVKRKNSWNTLLLQWSALDSCQQKIRSHSAWKSALTEQTLSPYKDLKKYF